MKDYYRKLITDLLPKISDELKLHEVYVLALMYADNGENGGASNG